MTRSWVKRIRETGTSDGPAIPTPPPLPFHAHTPHPPPHPETTWLLCAETFQPHANVWSYHYSGRPVNN